MSRQDELSAYREVLQRLVDMYVKNQGTNHEFITMIGGGKSARRMTFHERRADKLWRAWDDARELLTNPEGSEDAG